MITIIVRERERVKYIKYIVILSKKCLVNDWQNDCFYINPFWTGSTPVCGRISELADDIFVDVVQRKYFFKIV